MRLFLSILVTALTVPLTAYAQAAPKQVEVINDLLVVEVVNPAPPSLPVRWQLVGVTSSAFTGDLGGPWGANATCNAEFEGARMCIYEEARRSHPISMDTAWVDKLGAANCGSWVRGDDGTGITKRQGSYLRADGTVVDFSTSSLPGCSVMRPIACCALVP